MRRIGLVFSLLAALGLATNADAQTAGSVAFDFPGGAAVEAGLTSPKPVPPDADGNRRTRIAVPVGSQGTVYATTRADGTTVVYLIPDGEQPPNLAGLRRCGRYRDGDRLALNTRTLVLTSDIATAPTAAMMNPSQGSLNLGFRFGIGTGSLLGVVKKFCAESVNQNLTCSGDDRGVVLDVGVDAQWYLSRHLDVGVRVGYIKPSETTINATGTLGNQTLSNNGFARGHLWSFGGDVGYYPTDRIRINSGVRLAPWSYTSGQTFTFANQSQPFEQENSGIARGFFLGARHNLGRYGISLEGSRVWLKDTSVVGEDEPFDERFSMWMLAFHYTFASLRLWR